MKSVKINFLIHDDIVEAQFKDFISSALKNYSWGFLSKDPTSEESLHISKVEWEWRENTVYVGFE